MNAGIQPFRIEIHQSDVGYLHDRPANARRSGEPPGVGCSHGVPLDHLTELAKYWRTRYDWRVGEARTEFPRSKHFPAMEGPTQLVADLRAFFGPLQ
jgi:Epoxide hydrolase N terminus